VALKNSQYDAVIREYNRRQIHNKHVLDAHIRDAYEKIPRLAEIDQKVASLSLQKAKLLLSDDQAQSFDLPTAIAALSKEREELLTAYGYPLDYLTLHYNCPICKDTGYVENQKCSCFKKATVDMLYTQSNIKDILEYENFEHFSFDYYPNDIINPTTGLTAFKTAHQAVDKSREFIETFESTFQNLFIYGDTGVGKTYLSHCIGKALIDRAFCVMYFSAFDLFDVFAKNVFTKDNDSADMHEYIFDCDLLIIDDLGTELTNSFVSSQFFLCINERIIRKKSTIISTNLSIENFLETYSERTFSRISSYYTMIKLIGKDIRIQKKLLGGK
jgi:DNA replication protein DnaC